MSTPGMMLWTDAYLADTSHLTTLEHGAYLLTLMAMWRAGGSLPADEVRLARIARMTLDKWRKIAPTLLEFFDQEEGRITQKRLKLEHEKALSISEKRSAAGRAGVEAKSLKSNDEAPAFAGELPEQTESRAQASNSRANNKREREDASAGEPACAAEPDPFDVFWQAYPKRPNNPRKPAKQKFDAAVKRGADAATIIDGARRYAESRDGEDPNFTAMAVTWLHQERWNDDFAPARQVFTRNNPNTSQPKGKTNDLLSAFDRLDARIAAARAGVRGEDPDDYAGPGLRAAAG